MDHLSERVGDVKLRNEATSTHHQVQRRAAMLQLRLCYFYLLPNRYFRKQGKSEVSKVLMNSLNVGKYVVTNHTSKHSGNIIRISKKIESNVFI